MKEVKELIRLESIEAFFSDVKKSDSFCMCPNCSEKAIGSHVFSRSHILQPISNELNIYQFYRRPLIFIDDIFCYKLEPIVNAFKFKGFCKLHDNDLFKSIEPKKGYVDWTKKESQYLLSYRTICREIYVNTVTQKVLDKLLCPQIIQNLSLNFFSIQEQLTRLKSTKDTLDYYKTLLEKSINDSKRDFVDIHFKYIELPFQFDLCISAPIHVQDDRGLCYNTDYQEINIINVFPYYGKTIIIIGYLNEFDNKWMNNILPKFKSPYPHIVSSAFVDILYRAEFHAMSPSLYDSLDKDLLDAFFRTWQLEVNNFSNEIENQVSSLFYTHLNKLMPSTWKSLS